MLSKAKKILLSLLLSVFLLTNLSVPFAHAQTWYDQTFFGEDGWYAKVNDPNEPTEIFGERYTYAQVQWVIYGLFGFVLNSLLPPNLVQCIVVEEGVVDRIRTCLGVPEFIEEGQEQVEDARDNYRFVGGQCELCDDFDMNNPADWEACVYQNQRECELANGILSNNNLPVPLTNSSLQMKNTSITHIIGSNPVSSVAYFKNLQSRLKLVPEAKAQGFGFTAANPVMELWRLVRNITYFLLVIIVIAMAFMIMFRMKISPQTVISVQSALPKVVFTLILITFSYAIAGFMIDLMYVVIGLLAAILSGSSFVSNTTTWSNIFSELTSNWGVIELMGVYNQFFFPALLTTLLQGGLGFGILGATLIVPILITIIVGIVLMVITIKILWMLVKTYVSILIQIIIGPIQILTGALTGGGFGIWLKTLLANLAVFPITGFLFVLAFIFLSSSTNSDLFTIINWLLQQMGVGTPTEYPFGLQGGALAIGRGWAPPLTIGSRAIELMWLAASLVIISMIPKAADIAKKFILGGRFEMGSAIGEAMGPARWAYGQGERQVLGRLGESAAYHTTDTGLRGFVARQTAGLAVRRGYLDIPSPEVLRRRGVVTTSTKVPKKDPGDSGDVN